MPSVKYTVFCNHPGTPFKFKVKVKVMTTFPPTFSGERGYNVVRVRQGETAKIPCQSKGDPAPSVNWFSPLQRLIPYNLGSRFYYDRVSVVADGTLVVRMAQKLDTGNYTCRASNLAGGKTMIVGLEVEAPSFDLSQQEEDRSWSGNNGADIAHKSGSERNTNNVGTTEFGITSTPRGPLVNTSSNQNYQRGNDGATRNLIPSIRIAVPSGLHPALKSDNNNRFNRPGTRITTQFGTAHSLAINKSIATRVEIDEPDIANGRNKVGNSYAVVGEKNVVAENHKVNAKNVFSGAKSNGDNYLVLSSRVPNNGASADNQGVPELSRIANKVAFNGDDRRFVVTSGSILHNENRVHVKTVKHRAVRGQTILLPCPSRGSPPPRLTWLLPGNGVLPAPYYGSRLTVHRNGSLELRGLRTSDSGTLVCVVRGDKDETRIHVEMEVSDVAAEATSFHRGLSGERAIQDGTGLSAAHHAESQSTNSKSSSPRRVFSPVPVTQMPLPRGWPSRATRPTLGTVRTVTAPLVTISNGETLHLPCATSHNHGSLSWTTPNSKVLFPGDSVDSGRLRVQEDGTLIVQHTTVFDRGTYTCKAAGDNSSLVTALTVPVIVIAYPPRITKGPSPMTYTRPGVAVELPCLTTATPRATITWDTPDQIQLRVMGQARIYGNRYLSPQGSLVIQNPTSRDTGFYRCTANNVIGVDTKTTYLHVI